jgi:hypothetical protein
LVGIDGLDQGSNLRDVELSCRVRGVKIVRRGAVLVGDDQGIGGFIRECDRGGYPSSRMVDKPPLVSPPCSDRPWEVARMKLLRMEDAGASCGSEGCEAFFFRGRTGV